MSDSDNSSLSEFQQFVESVKSKIPINDLYTELTGEQFSYVDSRLRAKINWREDNHPSLCYVPETNLLWDFTDHVENSDKSGKPYNILDILQKCGGAINFAHALQIACDRINVEIPDKFKKKGNKELGHLPHNLGNKIREVWDACKQNLKYFIENPDKRPVEMINFFNERNLPFDLEYLNCINIGILPAYSVTYDILKNQKILRVGQEDKELNIVNPEYGNNSIVYPLYNIDGALCGLRFRRLDIKEIKDWTPVSTTCFYNAQRFKKRPYDRQILIVEGEMNLIAYAKAAYDYLLKIKENKEEVIKALDNALAIIYSTGSKSHALDVFKGEIKDVLYLQDHDISEEEIANPKDHPILKTCIKISKEINADNLLIVDWDSLSYVNKKFDLEDYLKYNNYDLKSITQLSKISLPRYACNCIKKYCDCIQDKDNKREAQIKYTIFLSDNFQYAQRKVFAEIAKKEFSIDDEVGQNLITQQREVKCGDYSIDQLGRIIQTTIDDTGNKRIRPVTNFYMRINDETTYYSHINNMQKKYYNVEVVVNGRSVGMGEISSEDIFNDKVISSFLPTMASTSDLNFMDPTFRGKNFSVITSLMNTIPIPIENKRYVFSSLGRPFESKCIAFFKTDKFCLFPKVSVIDGNVVENTTYDINLAGKDALIDTSCFEFTKLTDEQYRKAIELFWYDLRHVHDCNLIDSCIGVVFDSCTREIQGTGIVENDHGFPLYLAGQSGAYKSTSALAAMSLLGKFKSSNDLLSWNSTSLAITYELGQIGNLTHVLDDMKVDDMTGKEFSAFFQNIYGGRDRKRMDSSGTVLKGGNKLTCSIIITAENENVNIPESIAARMLVLRVLKCSNSVGAEREKHLDKMSLERYDEDNYNLDLMRGLMPRMIAWAHKRGITPYSQSIKKWNRIYLDIIKNRRNNIERPSDMISRIVAAFEQICEFLKEESNIPSQEIDARLDAFADFWRVQILNQIHRIEKQSSTNKVIDFLCQIINSESIGIKVYKEDKWQQPARIYTGYPIRDVTYPDGSRKYLLISTLSIVKAMNAQLDVSGQRISVDRFESDLKETGIIETDANGKPILFQKPDETSHKITKHCTQVLAIDYHKLQAEYARIKHHD